MKRREFLKTILLGTAAIAAPIPLSAIAARPIKLRIAVTPWRIQEYYHWRRTAVCADILFGEINEKNEPELSNWKEVFGYRTAPEDDPTDELVALLDRSIIDHYQRDPDQLMYVPVPFPGGVMERFAFSTKFIGR